MTQHPTDAKASQSGTTALRFDVIAGLTAAAVVLPKAMAYATVAGLPIAVGLYSAFIPMVIYALLGSSRVLRGYWPARSSVWRCRTAIRRSSSPQRPP
jgi:SulP family sulfate permease